MAIGTTMLRVAGLNDRWFEGMAGGHWRLCWLVLASASVLISMGCNPSPSSSRRTGSSGDISPSKAWSVIDSQVDKLIKLPPASDGNELRQRLGRAAAAIADRLDRNDIEQILLTAEEVLAVRHSSGEPGLTAWAWLLGMAIAMTADPCDEHHFVSRSRLGGSEWSALAMAAVDLYHDERSFTLLLKLALRHDGTYRVSDDHWDSPAVEACGFLRGYDPDGNARNTVEKHLRDATRQSKQDGLIAAQATLRAKYLKALIASWDYAKGLSEPRRRQYQDFKRRLWRAWSLSRGGSHLKYGQFSDAAGLYAYQEGDENFFLRIFESAEGTSEEVLIAEYAVPRLSWSQEGKQRLQAVATGDSPWAGNATRALKRMK